MEKVKKIVIVIPTLQIGGAETVATILANNWIKKNIDVTICLLYDRVVFNNISDKVKIIAISAEYKKVTKFTIPFQLRQILKKEKPDIIQSFLTEYNILCLLSTIGLGVPIFVSDRANPHVGRGFLVETLRKLVYPFARGIIAQTKIAKDVVYSKTNHPNIKVIPNPVKMPVLKNNPKQKNILNVGRLIPEKNQQELITAFANSSLLNGWKLQIVGDGPLYEKLVNKIREDKIDNVEMVGQSTNVEEYYEQASIFAFTSTSEGYPNAIAEAMSYGLPVVSYNCDAGPSDLIDDNTSGFLVKVGDIKSITNHLENLSQDDKLRSKIGDEGRKKVSVNSEYKIADLWLNFILTKKI